MGQGLSHSPVAGEEAPLKSADSAVEWRLIVVFKIDDLEAQSKNGLIGSRSRPAVPL